VKPTEHGAARAWHREIKDEWIEQVLRSPLEVQQQENGFLRRWGYIEEVNRHLRVVTLEDGVTVETVHFDRNYGKRQRR
jgi:hypothetical protein